MAELPPLPAGFKLDAPPSGVPPLPAGFVIDSPAQVQSQPETTGQMLRRELSPANLGSALVRPVVQAATAIPGIFADATMAGFNLLTGQNNQMPSRAAADVLDSVTRKPEGYGRGAEFASSVLLGSRVPMPQIGAQAPQQLAPRAVGNVAEAGPRAATLPITQTVRDTTLAGSRQAGYVVPPSTVKPTVTTRLVESLGGKEGTAQDAALRNQEVTNTLARRALGLGDNTPLDRETLNVIRQAAAPAYEEIRNVGRLTADPKYNAELAAVTQRFKNVAKDFPGLSKNEIDDIVKEVQKETFDADSAVDAISIIRDKATKAYASGDKMLGKSYRDVSNAMESLIERNLAAAGENGAGILKAFREARQLIAKTYSVEKALNESSGNVAAQKLGQQLAKNKPLSDELLKIAQFGRTFPKAAREVLDSGSVRNTDAAVSAVTTGLSGQPAYLLYPFARMGARNALLSETMQNSLLNYGPRAVPASAFGAVAPPLNELANLR